MDSIRQYILTITVASVICGIINSWVGKKGTYGAVIKLLTGLFMAVTMISPLAKIEFVDISSYLQGISVDADSAAQTGQVMAYESVAAIIKSETEAYILDKAASLELHLEVEVTLSDSSPPIPVSVTLIGSASPYARSQLSNYIADHLGISEENQIWT